MAFLASLTTFQALSLAAGALSAVGSIASGSAQARASEANAQISEQNASLERRRSAEEERLFRRDLVRLKGSQATGFASSGVTLEGTPLLVLAETAAEGEKEALAIRTGGAVASNRQLLQASSDRSTGKSARQAGFITGGGTLLGSAATVFKA